MSYSPLFAVFLTVLSSLVVSLSLTCSFIGRLSCLSSRSHYWSSFPVCLCFAGCLFLSFISSLVTLPVCRLFIGYPFLSPLHRLPFLACPLFIGYRFLSPLHRLPFLACPLFIGYPFLSPLRRLPFLACPLFIGYPFLSPFHRLPFPACPCFTNLPFLSDWLRFTGCLFLIVLMCLSVSMYLHSFV